MITERYATSFFGLDAENYTAETIANIWEVTADKIYEESNIYVSGSIYAGHSVTPETQGDISGSVMFSVVSTRSPVEIESETEYWNAYKEVTEQVRGRLGNPYMTITKETIDFFYFRKV